MEQPEPNKAQIRGKDLIGGIKVMPMGLDAAIKKRTSGEFKSEQRGGTMSFSNANQATSIQKETKQMGSFKEEVSELGGFNQVSSLQSASKQSSAMQSSSMQSSSMQSSSTKQTSSFQSSSSSAKQMSASSQMSSNAMSMSSQKSMSSMTSSKSVASSESNSVSFQSSGMVQQDVQQVSDAMTKSLVHNQEIEQDSLKTQIVSAITDLEGDREFVDFGRENKPIDLTSPPQTYSPTPKSAFTPTKQDPFSPSKQDMFSPPPLEPMEPPQPQPVLSSFTSEPTEVTPQQAPTRNGIQNGFSEFVSSSKNLEVQTIQESSQTQAFQMNGTHEESGSIQGSSSSSSLLQKIMTPAPVEYDTGSLKRRDPRKMFTDSSFYNAKHHPTVADQVEMAHRLSSAMFNEKNQSSKGQKMYLTRVQNSGGMHDDDYQKHDAVPNLKLVMNPEGKVHEWDDLPEDQKPNYSQISVHAAPNLNLPDVADPVAESLNAGIGKGGELFAKRRKRAENWVVDETSIGQAKPSAFADKFMQEQTQQQVAFQQQQQFEQQQREQISQQQISQQQSELLQQQQEAKQTFAQQQQFKQEQSLEIRRQQEEQMMAQQQMSQQQMDFPQNFQHTDLKARSFTPSLDLGVHNVQGINVWANTAPRGWSTSYTRTKATPPKSNPPTVSVCPATPSLDTEVLQQRMQETRIHEQEEQMQMQQQQQMMQMQQEQQMKFQMEQQEQIRIQEEQIMIQKQQEEQMMIQRQQEEQMMIQRQQEEQMMIQRQQEEQMMMQRQQEEQMRIQQQQEEQMRIQQQQAEQMRIQQQQEEQMRIQQQQEEQMRIQQQQEEQRRIQMQQEEQMRMQQQQEEQRRIQQQQEEQMRFQMQQEEQMRMQQQQEEQIRIQRQQEEQARQAADMKRQQEEAERQRQEQIQRQEMERQQQEMLMQQQSMSQKVTSSQISSSSSTTKSGVSEEELEAQKRREYEEWFKSQEKEALEYSACVQYQEKASESQNVVKTTVTETTQEQQSFSQQQQSSQQTVHNSSLSGLNQGFAVESRPEPVLSESQLAQPPMSSSSLFESSQSQSFAQQSSSIQQSSSSYSQSQTSKEVFESQEFSGGVMKGYKKKEDYASNQIETGETVRDSGVFGGIGGDNNSLVDSEFDYKKHTVKDLAKHFALVKPKADIPHAILPEQRMYNGDHGPALNYLNTSKSEMGSSSSTQSFMKKEISQEDFEASKQAYEMKKKQQQMESQQSQSTSSQSTVVKRSESSAKTEQTTTVLNERRQSLVASSLMMDPAKAHAESGIIDPSAILRGSDAAGFRSKSEGILGQSTGQAETDKVLNKWDNHNAIARGWGGVKENYHPVTFRGIYNVDSQKNFTSQNL